MLPKDEGKTRVAVPASAATRKNKTPSCSFGEGVFFMNKENTNNSAYRKKIDVRMLVLCGLMVALHIILSRFLSVNAWNIKIGFSFVAIFVAAYVYGPVAGALVGGLGDFLGAILFPIGAYFPGFTLNCALTGVIFGLLLHKTQSKKRIGIAVGLDILGLSLWVTPLWISIVYGSPYWPLILSRIPQILIMTILEAVCIFYLIKILERIHAKQMMKENQLTELQENRKNIRREKIAYRNSLSQEEREAKSKLIVERLVDSDEFKNARNIMIYKATKGEVRLEELEKYVDENGGLKTLIYPLCTTGSEMIPLIPGGEDSWQEGYKGITEPIKEKSVQVAPSEIDLLVCPCAAFDMEGNRMGMGRGFYDRFVEKCTNAKIVAVAFEGQKADSVYPQDWDKKVVTVFTEDNVYRF